MRMIPRIIRRARPNDRIAPSATPAPFKPAGRYPAASDDYTPLSLPPENPFLLRAFPRPGRTSVPGWMLRTVDLAAVAGRPSCRILGAYRAECERQTDAAALLDRLEFEAAVAEDLLILYPGDVAMTAYLAALNDARPTLSERRDLPSAVIR